MASSFLTLRVFLPFAAGYYFSYAFRSINALLGPQIADEFGLGAGDLGLLTSVYFLAFGLCQIPFGLLLDRYGPRRVDAVLLVFAAAGALVFALSSSFAGLVVGRALIGLGVSVCLMASLQAFMLYYPIERIATVNSRAFAAGVLGAITVTVPLEAALNVYSWRTIVMAFGALTLLASAAIFFVAPGNDRAAARYPPGKALDVARQLFGDPAFRRIAAMVGTTQSTGVALSTLWVATWLRDVAGYDRVGVGRALLVVNLALIAGFLAFGRLADARVRRGASVLPVALGGAAAACVCLVALALGVTTGALALWAVFTFSSTAATLGYSMVSRRYPKEAAGRVNTTLNSFIFVGMFLAQWGVGFVLELWPRTATGYAPQAYGAALGVLALLQCAGIAWLWSGRRFFKQP